MKGGVLALGLLAAAGVAFLALRRPASKIVQRLVTVKGKPYPLVRSSLGKL